MQPFQRARTLSTRDSKRHRSRKGDPPMQSPQGTASPSLSPESHSLRRQTQSDGSSFPIQRTEKNPGPDGAPIAPPFQMIRDFRAAYEAPRYVRQGAERV